MLTLGNDGTRSSIPYYISDSHGDNFIHCTEAELIDLRDQLIKMFPPEPVESPARAEALVNADARQVFADMRDGSLTPFAIEDVEGRCFWLDSSRLTQLYTELQAHFGDACYRAEPENGGGA